MIEFIKRILRNIVCGKEFTINAVKIAEYEKIKYSLKKFKQLLRCGVSCSHRCDISDPILRDDINYLYVLKGEELKRVEKEIPIEYMWTDTNLKEHNLILPQNVAEFFLKGRSWNEIIKHDCVSRYGMLSGKRRHLRIV